jgi:large subunit ribosomal protein L35
MPKLKSNRAAAKRFKRTKSGEFKRSKAFRRHLMNGKSSKRRRGLRLAEVADSAEKARLKRMLPYA